MIKQNIKTILILAFVCAGFFCFEKNCWAIDHIVISEIQITGEEFVELYNPTNNEINMTGWYWCYFSLNRDWNNPYRKKKFLDGAVIKPKKYYLIAMVDGELSSADWSLGYSRHFLNDANGSVVIFLSDPKIKTVEEAKQGKIDAVGWGNVDYVKEKNPVIFSGDDQSIKRKIENSIIIDSDDNDADFFKQPSNNVSNGNGNDSSNGIDGDDVDGGDGGDDDDNNNSEEKIIEIYKLGDIVINEFVSDPADGEVEWIELYNTTSKKIILTGWTIKEGSGAKTTLEGVLAGSGENKFFIIEKPKGNLNNKGDIIILRDGNETLIDQVAYGKWEDGNTGNNAPMTGDPYSVARKFDGQNSFNNANDFAVTTTLTKGASNIITKTKEEQELTDEISAEEKANYDYSNNIIISEIFPNPAGSDKENEFIELFNKGERDVNLTGWRLGDESKKKYEVRSKSPTLHSFGDGAKLEDASEENNMIIKAGGYLVVYRGESKIALNNGSDSAKLYQPLKDEPLQAVKYEKAIEGWSYNYAKYANERQSASWRTPSEKWVWSEIVTPGTANEIKTINHPPIVDFDCPEKALIGAPILFDSSDTIDEDGDKLKFNWSFGDGFTNELANPEHTFFKQGAWTVKLTVSDGENEIEKEKIVKVANTLNVDGAVEIEAPEGAQTFARLQAANNIIINEFLPNPEGADAEGEFIELYNQGGAQVNLINWEVDDSEAGSKPYVFDFDLWLGSEMYYVLNREESGLALNNTTDAARLFNNFDELVEEIKYEQAVEGEAYARGKNGKWFWTTVLTPGEENIISVADSNGSKVIVKSVNYNKNAKKEKQIIKTTLEKIHECEIGDTVKVAGAVAVKPGVLGSQYFYIVTLAPNSSPARSSREMEVKEIKKVASVNFIPSGIVQAENNINAPDSNLGDSAGIQVYNYKKDFPALKIGDYIEVQGELSVSSGELRLKTKTADDFKIIKHGEPPSASKANCGQVDEKYVGRLITVTGEVVERKSSIVYLDDGTDEVIVYLKKSTGIKPKSIKEGEIITVTGLVGRTKSGIRIMPRSVDDIIKKDPQSHSNKIGQVLGEVATSDVWKIAQRDKKIELFQYLLTLACGAIIVLAGLLVKIKIKNRKRDL